MIDLNINFHANHKYKISRNFIWRDSSHSYSTKNQMPKRSSLIDNIFARATCNFLSIVSFWPQNRTMLIEQGCVHTCLLLAWIYFPLIYQSGSSINTFAFSTQKILLYNMICHKIVSHALVSQDHSHPPSLAIKT